MADKLSVMNLIPGAQSITAQDLVRNRASWWYRGLGGATLEPGGCCLSFAIRSSRLPGIVDAYFQGSPYKVSTSDAVPEALSRLVPAFNFIETNSVSMPVIGPKFEPTAFVETRICDLIGDVSKLVREGRMEETPFTGALLNLSKNCLKRSPAEFAAAIQELPVRSEDRFEMEILSALEINLQWK